MTTVASMKPANPNCDRCGHPAFNHRLDDALNIGPGDPQAQFRCVWPMPDGLGWTPREQQCQRPDMVVPAEAGWPYNGAPEPVGAA